MPSGLRILQVISDADRRGAQVFAHDLGAELGTRGHTVTTVALGPGRSLGDTFEVAVLGRGVRDPRTLLALRNRMAAADVTIAHGASTGPACAIAGGGRRRPFVYRQVSDSRYWAPTRGRRFRVRRSLSRARVVVAQSAFHRDQLVSWIGVDAPRIRIVPNGVPPERFTPPTLQERDGARSALGIPGLPVVAFVGALSREKGADRLIEHAARLPDVQILVAGDGPERDALEATARRANGRVRFLGAVADVVPVYHAADVAVLPSRSDAMPATAIEAGLCALPVVATEIGAIPDVVVDGRTGVVVDPTDDDAFVAGVDALLRDPDRRAALGSAARAHCLEHYAIGPVAVAWERVLREAAAG